MTQADSVHSTPPINTSARNPAGLARQQRDREKALQRVAKLRQRASDEIERLLAFLDASDPYAMTELEEQVDDVACDSDADAEPSLGSFNRPENQIVAWKTTTSYGSSHDVDCELDHCDHEDSDPAEGKLQPLSLNRGPF